MNFFFTNFYTLNQREFSVDITVWPKLSCSKDFAYTLCTFCNYDWIILHFFHTFSAVFQLLESHINYVVISVHCWAPCFVLDFISTTFHLKNCFKFFLTRYTDLCHISVIYSVMSKLACLMYILTSLGIVAVLPGPEVDPQRFSSWYLHFWRERSKALSKSYW